LWKDYERRNPGSISDDACKEWYGTKLENFHLLPDALARAFFEWDICWSPVRDFLFGGVGSAMDKLDHKLAVIDFHDFQSAPIAGVRLIAQETACVTTPSNIGE
jgi:hypothetical protein